MGFTLFNFTKRFLFEHVNCILRRDQKAIRLVIKLKCTVDNFWTDTKNTSQNFT